MVKIWHGPPFTLLDIIPLLQRPHVLQNVQSISSKSPASFSLKR